MRIEHQSNHPQEKKYRYIIVLLLLFLFGLISIFLSIAWRNRTPLPNVASFANEASASTFNEYSFYLNNFGEVAEAASLEQVAPATATATEIKPTATLDQVDAGFVADSTTESDSTPFPTATHTSTSLAPIVITPTATTISDVWIFNPVADAFVTSRRPTDNFGRLHTLDMGSDPETRSYLRFDVPELVDEIAKVELRLRVDTVAALDIQLFLVEENAWDEYSVTFNDAPNMTTHVALMRGGRANRWVTIDVTNVVTEAGLLSFGLQTNHLTEYTFTSRESIYPPELVLTFGERLPEPTTEPTLTMTAQPTATATPETTAVPLTPNPTEPPAPIAPTATPTDLPPIQPPSPTEEPPPTEIPPTIEPTEEPDVEVEVVTFIPVADAFVHGSHPSNNYGTEPYLSLDTSPQKYGFLRFDTSGFTGTVQKVTLRVYSHDDLAQGMQLFDVRDDSWLEEGVTFTNAPSMGLLLGAIESVELNSWVEIDVSTAVIDSGLLSFGLSTPSSTSIEFSSRETSRPPELVLEISDYEAVAPPEPPDECIEAENNGIANGGFQLAEANWTFYSNGNGAFHSTIVEPTYCDSAAQISIDKAGTNVQLFQSGVILQADTEYTLRFAAKSSRGQDMSIYLQKHEPNYKNYGLDNVEINLTTEWRLYEITFTTTGFSGQVNNGRLRFWFAPYDQNGDVYWIDQVELIEN